MSRLGRVVDARNYQNKLHQIVIEFTNAKVLRVDDSIIAVSFKTGSRRTFIGEDWDLSPRTLFAVSEWTGYMKDRMYINERIKAKDVTVMTA